MVVRALALVTLIALATIVAPASAEPPKLPATLAWTAYDVGSSGYNQAVAIGAAMKNKYGVNLPVRPGKNCLWQDPLPHVRECLDTTG